MKIKISKENEKAIRLMMRDLPGDDDTSTFEGLVNYFIEQYIRNYFTDGDWYYKK